MAPAGFLFQIRSDRFRRRHPSLALTSLAIVVACIARASRCFVGSYGASRHQHAVVPSTVAVQNSVGMDDLLGSFGTTVTTKKQEERSTGTAEEVDHGATISQDWPVPVADLEVGKKYTGVVQSIVDFGAFVDIGAESNGLLHKSAISSKRVADVHDFLKEGQQVEVWVNKKQGNGKFGLSMIKGIIGAPAKPDLTPFEWVSPEDWFESTVHKIMPFGAFATISLPTGETADGLIHKSQISDTWIDDVASEVKLGQKVQVRIQSVEPEKNKMFLSMKPYRGAASSPSSQARSPPVDFSAFERIPKTQWLVGKVSQVTKFGAFVTVSTPDGKSKTDGLVHITQIKDSYIESVEAEVKQGQVVQVRVSSVDPVNEKLRLTMLWTDE